MEEEIGESIESPTWESPKWETPVDNKVFKEEEQVKKKTVEPILDSSQEDEEDEDIEQLDGQDFGEIDEEDDLLDQQKLLNAIKELRKENSLIQEETDIFGKYLSKMTNNKKRDFEHVSFDPAIKLKDNKKIEIVEREIESIQKTQISQKKTHQNLLREIKVKVNEAILEKRNLIKEEEDFKKSIIYSSTSVSKRTKKIISEKVEKYFDNFLRQRDTEALKLEQKTKKLKLSHKKLIKRLKRNDLANENVKAIDFAQLKIENEEMREKEKKLTTEIVALKSKTGKSQKMLTSLMENLSTLQTRQKKLLAEIKKKEDRFNDVEERRQKEEKIKDFHKKRNLYLRKHHNELRVPSVLEYVKIKTDLDFIKKEVSSWQRKNQIAKNNLKLYKKKFRIATKDLKKTNENT